MDWLYHGAPPPEEPRGDAVAWLYDDDDPAPRSRAREVPPARPAPRPAPRPKPESDEEPEPKHRFRRVLVVFGLLLTLWLAFLVYTPTHAWNTMSRVDDAPAGRRPAHQPGTTILLVGTDSREGLSAEQRKRLGTGDAEGARTDTMLIYHVPPKGSPALISLPRDSYLPIPGHKKSKLNAAYAWGGASLLTEAVEDATGLRLDGYLEIGFGGFVALVDAVGGVEVCLDKPMKDKRANIDLPKGCSNLDGVKALGYVRQRYQDPRGDLGRIERQREIIGKVIEKLTTPATILNPVRYWHLCHSIAVVKRGQETTLGVMLPVARSAPGTGRGEVISLTVPISNPSANTPAGSSVLWDEAKAKAMFGQIAKGDTSGLKKFR